MFVNYLTLIMINLVAGMALLAYFVATGLKPNKGLASGFGIVGLMGLLLGLYMIFNWPLPGSYNIVFGESTVLFGIVFLGAALSLAKEWDLYPVTLYGFFAGLYGVVAGVQIIAQGLTREPVASGIGFILAGLSGVLAPLALKWKENKALKYIGLALLILTLLFWAYTWYGTLAGHIHDYTKWVPDTLLMRQAGGN